MNLEKYKIPLAEDFICIQFCSCRTVTTLRFESMMALWVNTRFGLERSDPPSSFQFYLSDAGYTTSCFSFLHTRFYFSCACLGYLNSDGQPFWQAYHPLAEFCFDPTSQRHTYYKFVPWGTRIEARGLSVPP